MREIKFRAWNGKYMIDSTFGDWVSFDGVPYTEASKKFDTPNIEIQKEKSYKLMQFTGLKDKNGKEIYEGDIIEYKSYSVFKRWWSDTKEIPIIEEECKAQREGFQMVRNHVEFSDGGFRLGYHLTMKDVYRGQKFERGQSTHGDTESKEWDFEVIGNIYQNPELLNDSVLIEREKE